MTWHGPRMAVTLAVFCVLAFGCTPAFAQDNAFTTSTPTALQLDGGGSPLPNVLDVSGLTGNIVRVTATLNNIQYASSSLDIALQSPHGESVMLISDVGAEMVSPGTLSFDQAGGTTMPDSNPDTTGVTVYKPHDVDPVESEPDEFPGGPATAGVSLDDLNSSSPNGQWKLWAWAGSRSGSPSGSIGSIGGWTIHITTDAAPVLAVAPGALDFGARLIGSAGDAQTVTLTNTGNAPLTFSSAPALGGTDAGEFGLSGSDCVSGLAPGAACSLQVTFNPTSEGSKSAVVSVADNAAGSPHPVAVTGSASKPIPPPPGPSPPDPSPPSPTHQESGSPDIKVQSVSFSSPPAVGRPTALDVRTSDKKEAVTGVIVDFGEQLGQFAESACVAGVNKGNSASFHIPFSFLTPGEHTVKVTIFSGGCGVSEAHLYVFTVTVAPAATTAARGMAARRTAHAADTLAGPNITSKCKSATTPPSRAKTKVILKALLCVMNEQRKLAKLKPLKISKKLQKAALFHSRAMVVGKFFAHQGPKEGSLGIRLKKAKYRGSAGENIGAGAGSLATPVMMVNGWMHSSLHRANLLYKKWKTVGIGFLAQYPISTPAQPVGTFTTDFGVK